MATRLENAVVVCIISPHDLSNSDASTPLQLWAYVDPEAQRDEAGL